MLTWQETNYCRTSWELQRVIREPLITLIQLSYMIAVSFCTGGDSLQSSGSNGLKTSLGEKRWPACIKLHYKEVTSSTENLPVNPITSHTIQSLINQCYTMKISQNKDESLKVNCSILFHHKDYLRVTYAHSCHLANILQLFCRN